MSLKLFPQTARAIGEFMAGAPDIDGYTVKVEGDLPSPLLCLTLKRCGILYEIRFDRRYEDAEVRYFIVKESVREGIRKALQELPLPKSPSPAPLRR
jgi:hypothetical protein